MFNVFYIHTCCEQAVTWGRPKQVHNMYVRSRHNNPSPERQVQDVRPSPAAETMFPICRHDNDKLLNDSKEGGISS